MNNEKGLVADGYLNHALRPFSTPTERTQWSDATLLLLHQGKALIRGPVASDTEVVLRLGDPSLTEEMRNGD